MTDLKSTLRSLLLSVLLAAAVGACSDHRDTAIPALRLPASRAVTQTDAAPPASGLPLAFNNSAAPRRGPEIVLGHEPDWHAPVHAASAVSEDQGEYTLNFENADIRDVVKAVLGDILKLNYTIDPAVQGAATIHTARPLPRAAVLPAVEAALRIAGVVLLVHGDSYEVVPAQDAARRAGLALAGPGRSGPGFRVELVPLRFVGVGEIQRLLEPVTPPGTLVRTDPARNLIILAGTAEDLAALVDTISVFDVDWLRSQSFALYPLSYAPARAVAAELGQVIGSQGPLAGLVRIVPIERLNAILVVSKQRAYVEEMRGWIDRFDRGGETDQPRLFVYHVQNGRATDLAQVLDRILGKNGGTGAGASTTPGPEFGPPEAAPLMPAPGAPGAAPPAAPLPAPPVAPGPTGAHGDNGLASIQAGDVRITADDTNNALIIMATPERYRLIESALQQLDTVPLQVMLEAVVAEVTLTDDLKYGVQYFFKAGEVSGLRSSVAPSALTLASGGFSLLFSHGTSITAVLDLLSTVTNVRVLSSPEVLVLNNHTAFLQVGDQVPIATASAVSVVSPGAPIVNSIQLRDTGVILHVTPRVNRGGMVLLEVGQEVSNTTPTTSSQINSPTIQERRISSSVAVQDGQTVALGGLISDSRTDTRTGVPGLRDLPVLGNLFGDTEDHVTRTELLVLITPHVVRDQKSAQAVTDELRAKLPLIRTFDGQP